MQERDDLLRVCALLNAQDARYFIVGGHACILHGHVRTTEDVDVLVEDSAANLQRVIAGLSAQQCDVIQGSHSGGTCRELSG